MASEHLAIDVGTSKAKLQDESVSWAAKARGLRILDRESYVTATNLLRSVKGLRTEVQNFWAPHIDAAMETKRKAELGRKALVDEKDHMEAPLVDAEAVIKRALLAWETTQEQIRREQERVLQAEAARQAEAITLDAAASLEREANATGDAAMLREAQDILAQPIDVPVVSVAKLMPKVHGVTYRDNWKAHPEIDVKTLAGAIASGVAPLTFLQPNMTAINQWARATQGGQAVPGVRVFNDRQIAARG